MNPNMFSISQPPDASEDFEFNYAVPAPSPAPMMTAAMMASQHQQQASLNTVVMATNGGNYATSNDDDFGDLEDKLCELMIDEDTLDHSPLASVQEIDADENVDESSMSMSTSTTNNKNNGKNGSSGGQRAFRIDDEQIIDDKQLLEHQENDQSFLINDNLIKLFRIYQQIVARKRAERAHHGKRFQHNSSFDLDASSSGGGNNDAELMDQEMSDTDGPDYQDDEEEQAAAEEDSRVKINEVKSMLMTSSSCSSSRTCAAAVGQQTATVRDDEESAHDAAFFNGTLSEADLMVYEQELPKNLIVTSIPSEVFEKNNEYKAKFEQLFLDIDAQCKFCYFRIFKRCCIQYENGISAVLARFQLDDQIFLNDRLRIFLTKPIKLKNSRPFLEPPQNEKTFLISPPSSPPVGWEQNFEDPPVVNLDLIAALSKLNPDQPCEVVKSTCGKTPSIIIHPCPDIINDLSDDKNFKRKYMPTKRPAFDF